MAATDTAKTTTASPSPKRRRMRPRAAFHGVPVRTIAVVVGVVGLTALVAALFGSRRLGEDYVRPALVPLTSAVESQADRVWAETRSWRKQAARLLDAINTDEVREAIADRLSHWLQRLR
jgi:hypothetical protein